MMDSREVQAGTTLCSLCRSVDFSNSLLHQHAVDAAYRWEGLPYQPSDLSGKYYVYPHYPKISNLVSAAEGGCHSCIQLRYALRVHRGHESGEPRHDGPLELRYYEQESRKEDEFEELELYLVAKTIHAEVKVPFDLVQYSDSLGRILLDKAMKPTPRIGSPEDFQLARKWLGSCLSRHLICTDSQSNQPTLPTRVLDTDLDGRGSIIKLTSSQGRKDRYITLSHVWGHARMLTTKNATINDRMNGIPMDSLPQTFKDTVAVARELSVRFVWIDSLCIVQDSAHDWEVESRKMGEYYANSLLTVAAISASSSSGGLFGRRNPLELTPCPVTIKLPGSNSRKFGFFRPSQIEDPSRKTDGFQRPPLWQRAWVLQERLLSPRLLMFSKTQMSWRCRSKEASEQIPEGSSMWIGRSNEDRVVKPILDRLQKQDSESTEGIISVVDPDNSNPNMKDISDAWYDLIMLYGKCNLTYASDVFPAISGIASSISRATGAQYVAGLWKSDLHRGLMWTAPDSTSSRTDLRECRAPSWSWASLPATCTFFVRELIQDKPDSSCMDIEDVVVQVKGANPFGEISSGRLQIKGFLKPACPYFREGGIDPVLERIKARSRSGDSLFDLNTQNPVGRYTPDNIDRRHITQIWCSPIMTEVHPGSRRKENQIGAQCLALYPLDRAENLYMRVGFVWIHDFEWFGDRVKSSYFVV